MASRWRADTSDGSTEWEGWEGFHIMWTGLPPTSDARKRPGLDVDGNETDIQEPMEKADWRAIQALPIGGVLVIEGGLSPDLIIERLN